MNLAPYWTTCIGVPMLVVLGGCRPTESSDAAAPGLLCSDPRVSLPDSGKVHVFGTQPIYEGRLHVVAGRLEFRPCDRAEIYLLAAELPLEDAMYEYASTQAAAADAPIYLRFNGHQLTCEGNLPDKYAGVVQVSRVQAHYPTVPPNCQ